MILTEREMRRRHLWCVGCAVAACGMAALVLWSWAAGVSDLLSFDPRQIPMAPSTALLFLVLTSSLLVWLQRSLFQSALAYTYGAAGLAALAGLLALLRPSLGWGSPLEQWLAQGAVQAGAVPVGQMSPMTGALLVALAAALLLSVPPLNRRRGARWGAGLVSGMLLAASAGVAVSYGAGSPWLFGGALIPPSLPSTLAFLLLGLALLALPPPATASAPERRPTLVHLPWLLALLLMVLFGTTSAIYLRFEQALRRSEALELMTSVSKLKVAEIGHWRTEHWNAVHYFATDPLLVSAAQTFLRQPDAADARALVLRRFNMIASDGEFPLVALFDTNAVAHLTLPERPDQPPELAADLIADMRLKRQGLMTDLHLDPVRRFSHIDLVFPLFAPGATNAPEAGFCLVRLDPHPYLFPLLRAWPTASRSAEIVLIRREGNDVVFLNEPRQATHKSLPLRLPLDPHSQVPAVMAALGRTGTVEGVDYRGVSVLADIRAIPDSNWLLITKLDREELFAPLRRQAWLTLLLTLALAGLVGVAIWLARKQREVRIVRGDLALERERYALAERVELLMKSANDIILAVDERWRIVETNDRAVQAYGYTPAELRGRLLADLRPATTRANFALDSGRLMASGQLTFETIHQRKDGTTFPVEVSARKIADGGPACVMGIVRDITERKAHEREIARLSRLYATLSQINQCIVHVTSRAELFREVCRVTAEFSGFNLVWIGWLDPATHEVVPAGSAGDDQGYLDKIKVYMDDRPEGQGPVGTCLRENRPVIFNDFVEDPRAHPWQHAALVHGLRAVAALPLRLGGHTCGTFAVYADEPGVFQDKERALLEEAAADISFALDHLAQVEKHHQTDAALHESDERYRLLADNTDDFVHLNTADGRRLYTSPAYFRATGWTVDDLTRDDWRARIHPDDLERVVAVRAANLRGETTVDEYRVARKDGSWLWVHSRCQPLCGPDGRVEKLVLWAHDITERKQAAALLAEERSLLRALIDQIPDSIFVRDTANRFVLANVRMAQRMAVASPADLLGKGDADFYSAEQAARFAAEDREVFAGRALLNHEEEIVLPDGARSALLITKMPLKDAQGNVTALIGIGRDITERKRAEDALRQAEEKYRGIFEQAVEGIYQSTPEGTLLSANPAMAAIHGYASAADFMAGVRDIAAQLYVDADRRAAFKRRLEEQGEVIGVEHQVRRRDGRLIWVSTNARAVRDAGGRMLFYGGTVEDITARKQAEDALRESEEQFRAMFELASIGMAQADPHTGRFLRVNRQLSAMTGYSPAELLQLRVRDLTHPDDRAADGELFQRVIRGDLPSYQIEKRYICKNGTLLWVNINMTVLRSPHGRPLRTMATIEDISGRKRAETEREALAQQRQLALSAAHMGWWHYDPASKLAVYDERFQDIFGVAGHAGPNADLLKLLHPDDLPRVWSAVEAALNPADRTPYSVEYRVQRPDGTQRWVEAHGLAVFEGEGAAEHATSFVGTVADITGRKRMEEEREIMVRLLSLVNAPSSLHELMQQVTRLLHDWFACEAVGIRLRAGEDFPYFETRGFPAAFVRLEDHLCHCDAEGRVVRDAAGQPVYECMCGNVLCGRFDASKPFFTARGSFWANDTTRLLATTTDADRQTPTRNRCNGEGYVSVALVALRTGETTYGLLQLNDKRKHRFTPERIALLERLADSLAISIAHRQNQAQLQESEEKYRHLVDHAGEAIYVAQEGLIRFANRMCAQLTGFSEAELLGRASSLLAVPEECEHVARHQHLLARGETPAGREEFRIRTRDGAERWLSISSVQIQWQNRPATLNFATDITGRKRAEEALQLQGAALAAAANAIVITDAQGLIEWANPAFTTFTGYNVAEAQGRNPRDLIKSGEHEAAFYKELWDTILAGHVWHGEMINRRKNGTLYTEDMTVTPLRDAAGAIAHFIAIKQDITERKSLETHLLRNQRLESVGRLASGVAHDLNNILAPVLLAPPLLREAISDPEARSLIDTIESSAKRGAEIIKQLLTFGRGLKGERIPIQLRTLVREMLKLIRETFPKDIVVRTQMTAELPLVTGDATQLHQILMNLCVNARDAMPAGGELVLSLAPVTLDAAAATELPDARPGRFLLLGVNDSGTGIAPENLDKIFDPFFTTKPIGEGTGLGLSTVLGIVRSHAGFVQVQTRPGQGTRFNIYLPLSERMETAEIADAAVPALPQGHGEQVLIVDDEGHLRNMARRFLEGNGYRVLEAQDGVEALQLLDNLRVQPQVLLTDLIMPRMDGLTLLRTLKQKKAELKLIAMGGLPPSPEVLLELGLSPRHFIPKPFASATLLNTLQAVLNS